MGKGDYFHKVRHALSVSEVTARNPLVEILGHGRVLIENYDGILVFEPARIDVAVSFGRICIGGSNLILQQLSGEQLVILGQVESIVLRQE